MKKIQSLRFKYLYAIVFLVMLLVGSSLFLQKKAQASWGFWAHQRINRLAVFTLPPEMIKFYKKNIEYVTEHAIDPDKRRYASKGEAPRHYIDIDHYGVYPFDSLPRQWDEAVEKYTEDTLNAYGIAPWNIERFTRKLTRAFEEKNTRRILQLSADLGHYIGDGHVPLHTTKNYNGQLTNQKGIHGFWESRLPELFGDDYDYWVGKAQYLDNINEYTWKFILESASAVDSVLAMEQQVTAEFDSDQKYCYEQRGVITMKTYCEDFSARYGELMDGMVERRMRKAVLSVGSFWFTAWVNAGQPDLDTIEEWEASQKEEEEDKALEKLFKEGAIKGREHSN